MYFQYHMVDWSSAVIVFVPCVCGALFPQTVNWADLLARKFKPSFIPTIVSRICLSLFWTGYRTLNESVLLCTTCAVEIIFTVRLHVMQRTVLLSQFCPSVCLSVRPSVKNRSCTKMAKPRIRLTTPNDSPETLVFRCQKSWRNSNDITPNGGAK